MVRQQLTLVEVGARDPCEQEVRVAQRPDQLPHRASNLAGVEDSRRDLVQERREEVVVVAVDEQHVDRRVFQASRAGETAETGTRDHDPRPAHFSGGLRNRPEPPRRRLAIFSRATPPPVASSSDLGSFCFFLMIGSQRSPCLATRARTWAESNTSRLGSFFFRQFSTSSHVTGVDTVGRARARSEYTFTVVLYSSFWLQSMRTRPVRSSLSCLCTTSSGCCSSNSCASPFDTTFVSTYVTFVLSGTYSCKPLDPDVFAQQSRPCSANTSRSIKPTLQHSTMVAGGPGSKSKTSVRGSGRFDASDSDVWNSSVAIWASHTIVGKSWHRQ